MRIDPKSPSLPTAAAGATRRGVSGQRFAPETQGSAPSATAHAAVSLASVDALLALQGEQDSGERRRRSLRRGHDLLDALDRLKAALLSGRVPVADLRAIAARLAERAGSSGDPKLDDLLAHIELRAEVELAKLGRV
jgi:hypothetical protein